MWGKEKPSQTAEAGGSFDEAAARVRAGSDEEATRNAGEVADAIAAEADRFEIRPEWATATAWLCFLPAAKLSHPAYALTDEEAEKISPQIQALMQALMQAIADIRGHGTAASAGTHNCTRERGAHTLVSDHGKERFRGSAQLHAAGAG